jgi:hypothetical protein
MVKRSFFKPEHRIYLNIYATFANCVLLKLIASATAISPKKRLISKEGKNKKLMSYL